MLWDSEQQSKGEKKVIGELVGSVKQVKAIKEPRGCQGPVCYLLAPTHSLAQPGTFLKLVREAREVLTKSLRPLICALCSS